MLRIHDIFVRIRIQPLTNGSGFGSGHWYNRHWPSRRQQKTNFFIITFLRHIYIIFQRKKSQKKSQNSRNQGCLIFLLDDLWLTDPDPGGPITYGYDGSGSAPLLSRPFKMNILPFFYKEPLKISLCKPRYEHLLLQNRNRNFSKVGTGINSSTKPTPVNRNYPAANILASISLFISRCNTAPDIFTLGSNFFLMYSAFRAVLSALLFS